MRFAIPAAVVSLAWGLCLGHADVCSARGAATLGVRGGLSVTLSSEGQIVGLTTGPKHVQRAITAETALAGCQREGKVAARKLDGGGIEFVKHLLHTVTGNRCILIERLRSNEEQHSLGD